MKLEFIVTIIAAILFLCVLTYMVANVMGYFVKNLNAKSSGSLCILLGIIGFVFVKCFLTHEADSVYWAIIGASALCILGGIFGIVRDIL